MAPKGIEMGLVLFLVAMLWGGATAQSGCIGALTGMVSCLNYVTGNSSTPSQACCSSLASVVQTQPQCLCSVLNGGAGSALGISINQTLALALPAACKVRTPPVSQCNAAANGPTTSAAASGPATSTAASGPTTSAATSTAASGPTTSAAAPADSPTGSPEASSTETPEASTEEPTTTSDSNIPSGGGFKTAPLTNSGSSDRSNISVPIHLLVLLFVVSITRF